MKKLLLLALASFFVASCGAMADAVNKALGADGALTQVSEVNTLTPKFTEKFTALAKTLETAAKELKTRGDAIAANSALATALTKMANAVGTGLDVVEAQVKAVEAAAAPAAGPARE